MSQIIVKLKKGDDGNVEAMIGVALQIQATFKGGIWEGAGRRKVGKKFIEAACKQLVKQIGPKLQEALAQEQKYYDHPETIPAPTPENELRGTPVTPGPDEYHAANCLHPAIGGGDAGGPDHPGVQGSDKEPDNSD